MAPEPATGSDALPPRALISFQMGNSKDRRLADGFSKSKHDKKLNPTNLFSRLNEGTGISLKNRRRNQLSSAKQPNNEKSEIEQLGKVIDELRISNNHLETKVLEISHERDIYLASFTHRLNEGIDRAERQNQQFDDFARLRKRTCENGIFVFGPRIHTQSQIEITLEILRRAAPAHSYLMEDVYKIACAQEHLEFEEYIPQIGREETREQGVDRLARRNEAVAYREAWSVVRKILIGERKAALECLVRHGLYGDSSDEIRARILDICIQFFDRRLSYQVWKSTLQKLNDCPLLIIGGDIHTVEYQNINPVVDDCDEYN